jgi:hypothetical protein
MHDSGQALWTAVATVSRGVCAADCVSGRNWTCLGHVSWPRPTQDGIKLTTLNIEVRDYISRSLFSQVDVSVCARNDPSCASPKAHGVTDANGSLQLQFPNQPDPLANYLGLDGYLQAKSLKSPPEIVPWRYYWGFPLSENEWDSSTDPAGRWNLALTVLTPGDAMALSGSTGITYNPMSSVIIALAVDCFDHGAPDVQIALDPQATAVKTVYGLNPADTATNGTNTFVTFANAPEGTVNVVATPLGLGKVSSRQRVDVRAGWETVVGMLPTP